MALKEKLMGVNVIQMEKCIKWTFVFEGKRKEFQWQCISGLRFRQKYDNDLTDSQEASACATCWKKIKDETEKLGVKMYIYMHIPVLMTLKCSKFKFFGP